MKSTKNINLNQAKIAKNDEFYTQLIDIEKELSNYMDYFENKVVFCNCDNPKFSNFWRYFSENFEKLKLKRLIATYLDENCSILTEMVSLKHLPPYIIQKKLEGNGDFRSDEVVQLLKDVDIVCTNPPFSLFLPYIQQLIAYKKDFLIIGNVNAAICNDIFSLFQQGKVWFGNNLVKEFIQPNGKLKKFGNITWYANIKSKQKHNIGITNNFNSSKYCKYSNFDAINIDKLMDIPLDYYGIMGVPVSFLQYYNPDEFVILGMSNSKNGVEMGVEEIGEEWIKLYKNQGGTAHLTPSMRHLVYIKDGKAIYPFRRIIIKRKKPAA